MSADRRLAEDAEKSLHCIWPTMFLRLLDERDQMRDIIDFTVGYLRRYGLANTSGDSHADRKQRVEDILGEIAELHRRFV